LDDVRRLFDPPGISRLAVQDVLRVVGCRFDIGVTATWDLGDRFERFLTALTKFLFQREFDL